MACVRRSAIPGADGGLASQPAEIARKVVAPRRDTALPPGQQVVERLLAQAAVDPTMAGTRANPMANPSFRRYAQQYLHLIDQPKSATTRDQVRQLMFGLLPAGRCSLKTIAHSLGVDRQTIHRHLVSSGTTYSKLLDEVRSELAARYVREGDRRFSEIGEMLGFSQISAFSRWFRQRFGMAPKTWRGYQPAPPSVLR
jgi:AraC-like DNA-binding protein